MMSSIVQAGVFRQVGALTFGYSLLASSEAFGQLTATQNSIVLSIFLGRIFKSILHGHAEKFEFNKTQIKRISTYNWTLPGIRIFHTKENYPPFIVFFSFRIAHLEAALRRLGYTVEG